MGNNAYRVTWSLCAIDVAHECPTGALMEAERIRVKRGHHPPFGMPIRIERMVGRNVVETWKPGETRFEHVLEGRSGE